MTKPILGSYPMTSIHLFGFKVDFVNWTLRTGVSNIEESQLD
jgi:hypothetical protein